MLYIVKKKENVRFIVIIVFINQRESTSST